MWNETQKRSVFKLRLKRGRKSYTFQFGQSIQAGNTSPEMYSVLACLTKYNPESYSDFCGEYGYSLYDENTGRTNKQTERIIDLRKMYDKLALCTFNKFFVGKLGKTAKTRNNQLIKFIQLLTN